jgi:2-iminobutanoate/2-iminopropanoate deaminase
MSRLVPALLVLVAVAACHTPERAAHIKAENALGPYSGAVISGDYCFVSGKIGRTSGSVEDETGSALDALEAELGRAGLALDDVVFCQIYLTDILYYSYVNAVYARRFKEPYPARACVAVSALPGKARVEILAVARRR